MAGDLQRAGRIIVVASDLIRESRVAEGARALGYDVAVAATLDDLREALRSVAADLLILDLQADGVPWQDALAAAREDADGRIPVLAFGRHAKPDTLRAARDAGCALAVPRSRLVEELPRLIERARGAT